MSQEILYTSAPQGLKPGSRGFCTVVSTSGMAKNLAERLESLSGYRHAFPPLSAQAVLNPVNYSHLLVTVGGRRYHVLSRICDAGLDYTQRSNKLAHHVALDPGELPAAGPAAVLAAPGFCETTWDRDVRILPRGRAAPECALKSGVCTHWRDATGDAGWAGVLAASAGSRQPMSVIFPAGTATLPLVAEALNLFDPSVRWSITFSTYFTKLPAGVDCSWRFVLDGTVEARALRRNPHAPKIDLCGHLPPAPESDLVAAARKGDAEPWRPRETTPLSPPPRPPQLSAAIDARRAADDEVTYALAKTWRQTAPPLRRFRRKSSSDSRWNRPARRWRRIIFASVGFVLLVGGGLGAAYYAGRRQAENIPQLEPRSTSELPELIVATRPQVSPRDAAIDAPEAAVESRTTPPAAAREAAAGIEDRPRRKPATEPEPPTTAAPRWLPLADIRRRNNFLPLPPRNQGLTAGKEFVHLGKVDLGDRRECRLTIVGDDVLLGPGRRFQLQPTSSSREGDQEWSVVLETENALARNPQIAVFRLVEHELQFQWRDGGGVPASAAPLEYCLLKIEVGDESALCRLSRPQEMDPMTVRLDTHHDFADVSLPVDGSLKELRMDVALIGVPGRVEAGRTTELKAAQVGRFSLFSPEAATQARPQPELAFETKFDTSAKQPRLMCALEFDREQFAEFVADPQMRFPQVWFADIQKQAVKWQGELQKKSAALESELKQAKKTLEVIVAARRRVEGDRPPEPPPTASQAQIVNYEARFAAFAAKLDKFAQPEEVAGREVDALQRDLKAVGDRLAAWQQIDEQAGQRLEFFKQVETDARIHFRIYVSIAGQEVELVRTKGAPFDPVRT